MSGVDLHGNESELPDPPSVVFVNHLPGSEWRVARLIKEGAVVVLLASIGTAATRIAIDPQLLSPDEIIRSDRFLRREDRDQFVLARVLSRLVLSRRLGISPNAVPVVAERFHKPFVMHPAAKMIDFSITHSDGWVACCFAEHREVGIDLEKGHRVSVPEVEKIAARILTQSEFIAFLRLAPSMRRTVFLEFWRRKEALTKAAGLGFRGAPERIVIADQDTEGQIIWRDRVTYLDRHWHLSSYAPRPEVDIALAFSYEKAPLQTRGSPKDAL